MGLHVQYLCANTASMDKEMKPHFAVVNGGTDSVPLTSLTIRYYFTSNGSTNLAFNCDYAMLGCGSLTGSFGTASGTGADHYLEVAFTGGGDLAAGTSTGEIQARFHDAAYQVTFDQTDDYSFDATKTSFVDWDKVTLYQGGTLVWGVEP